MKFSAKAACLITLSSAFTLPVIAAPGVCANGFSNNGGSLEEPTPTSDFVVNADGTVSHTKTGLTWRRCVEGVTGNACESGVPIAVSWANGLKSAVAANTSKLAGASDWRLPSKRELESIIDVCGVQQSTGQINGTAFPSPSAGSDCWTSTTIVSDPSKAFSVWFAIGTTRAFHAKTDLLCVRLVRGGGAADAADITQP